MDFFTNHGVLTLICLALFTNHRVLTLICLALFPRLTLLIASSVMGGGLRWLGLVFTPHLLVAILALPYWDTNPVLVVITWIMAFGGTMQKVKPQPARKDDEK